MESSSRVEFQERESRYCDIVWRLFVVLESRSNFSATDSRLSSAREQFRRSLDLVLASEPGLLLQARHGLLFVNGVRIPVAAGAFSAVQSIVGLFHRRSLAGLMFAQGVGVEDLERVEQALAEESCADETARWSGLARVQPIPEDPLILELEQGRASDGGQETHLIWVSMVRNLVEFHGDGGLVEAAVAHLCLQQIVDAMLRQNSLMAWVNGCAGCDPGVVRHAVRTGVLAALIAGQRGSVQREQSELGVKAMLAVLSSAASSESGAGDPETGAMAPIIGLAAACCRLECDDPGIVSGQLWALLDAAGPWPAELLDCLARVLDPEVSVLAPPDRA